MGFGWYFLMLRLLLINSSISIIASL